MSKSKKILLVHRYYYPDTPAYAVMLKKIAEHLSLENSVSVLTSFPSYYGATAKGVKKREIVNEVQVTRLKLLPEKNRNFFFRIINTFLFAIGVFFKILLRPKYDVITVATTPPIIMAITIRIVSFIKGNKYIYHCQDIYPEIAFYNKNLKSKKGFKFLRYIDKINNKKASKIIVLSKDMKNTLVKERKIAPNKISIINNFIRTSSNNFGEFNYKKYGISKEDFIVVFCGNIGKLQNLNTIIETAHELKEHSNIKFVFIGEGVEAKKLKKQSGDLLNKTIFFIGYLKSEIALNALKQSHLGIISISEPTYKTAYPSKTMTYLNAGLPVLAFVNEKSELAKFIEHENLGRVAPISNLTQIPQIILDIQNNYDKIDREHIQKIAHQEFGEKAILNKWSQLIETI